MKHDSCTAEAFVYKQKNGPVKQRRASCRSVFTTRGRRLSLLKGLVPLRRVRADLRRCGQCLRNRTLDLATPGIGAYTITCNMGGSPLQLWHRIPHGSFGVDQATPVDAYEGNCGTGATLSTVITTVATHALITARP
jgi:hypothetical protein